LISPYVLIYYLKSTLKFYRNFRKLENTVFSVYF
jgi:hypothetical protein